MIKKVRFLLCRIPSAIQSYATGWVRRTAREQRGVAGGKGSHGYFNRDVYTGGKKALLKVHAFIQTYREQGIPHPSPGWGVQQPSQPLALSMTNHLSSSQQLNVLQHFIESLSGRRFGVLEGDFDPAVEAEGLQLQPDESKAIVIKENKNTRCSLGAGEAVASNKPRSVKTAGREDSKRRWEKRYN